MLNARLSELNEKLQSEDDCKVCLEQEQLALKELQIKQEQLKLLKESIKDTDNQIFECDEKMHAIAEKLQDLEQNIAVNIERIRSNKELMEERRRAVQNKQTLSELVLLKQVMEEKIKEVNQQIKNAENVLDDIGKKELQLPQYFEDLKSIQDSISLQNNRLVALATQMQSNEKNIQEMRAEAGDCKSETLKSQIEEQEHEVQTREKEFDQVNRELTEQQNLESKLLGEINALTKQIEEIQVLTSDVSLETIENEVTVLRDQIAELEKYIENLKNTEYKAGKDYKKAQACYTKFLNLQKKTLSVKRLNDVINGKLSGKRITFESFMHARLLDSILEAGNKRLSLMTNNRYRLQRNKKEIIDIDVFDRDTAQTRSASTLSGGEAFMASLALALGLSDVVERLSGGVSLECMFIDEGFGTLDIESLRQSVQVLQNMCGAHKLVGIISHIGELKNTIEKKILVQSTPTGSFVKVN